MQKVIDSNYLQSKALRDYLSANTNNFAVLTDSSAMEAYKGDTLKSIYPSMKIVCEFPRQIIILKPMPKIVGLSGREKRLQRRLIDQSQTFGFPDYCATLSAARSGNKALEKRLVSMGKEASEHFEKVMVDAATLPEALVDLIKVFTQQELDVIRKGLPLTQELASKIVKQAMTMAVSLGVDHPQWRGMPSLDELPNTFLLRYSLSGMAYMVNQIGFGGFSKKKPEKLRNDIVDLTFSAYATYFDGLLSSGDTLLNYRKAGFRSQQQLGTTAHINLTNGKPHPTGPRHTPPQWLTFSCG